MPHCDQRHRLSCSSYLTARPPCFAEIYSPWASTTPLRNPFKTPTSSSLSAAPGGQGGSLVLAEVGHQGERFPFDPCYAGTISTFRIGAGTALLLHLDPLTRHYSLQVEILIILGF